MFCEGILEIQLDAGHLHRRQKLAVGKLRKPLGLSADSRKFLHVVVPRCDIRVTNRPIYGNPVSQIGFEIQIAPAVALATPHDRFAADLTPANPGKMFAGITRIRVLYVAHEKLVRELVASVVALALDRLSPYAFRALIPI